jgi:hypothetical protein
MCSSVGAASASATSNDDRRAQTSATSGRHPPETEQQAAFRDALEAARKSREANDLIRASVKVLFLDIDGVVNNKHTKKNFHGFLGIDSERTGITFT